MYSITRIPQLHASYGIPQVADRPKVGGMIKAIINRGSVSEPRPSSHTHDCVGEHEEKLRASLMDGMVNACGWKPSKGDSMAGHSAATALAETLARSHRVFGARIVNFLVEAGAVREGMLQAAKADPSPAMQAAVNKSSAELHKAAQKVITSALQCENPTGVYDGSKKSDRTANALMDGFKVMNNCRASVGTDALVRGILDGPVLEATLGVMAQRCPATLELWAQNPDQVDLDAVLDRKMTYSQNSVIERQAFSVDMDCARTAISQLLKTPEYVLSEKAGSRAGGAPASSPSSPGSPVSGGPVTFNGGNQVVGGVRVDMGEQFNAMGKLFDLLNTTLRNSAQGKSDARDDAGNLVTAMREEFARLRSTLDGSGTAGHNQRAPFGRPESREYASQLQMPPHAVRTLATMDDPLQQSGADDSSVVTHDACVMRVDVAPLHDVMKDLIQKKTTYPKDDKVVLSRGSSFGSVDSGVNTAPSSTAGSIPSSAASSRKGSFAESYTLEQLSLEDVDPLRPVSVRYGKDRRLEDPAGEWKRYVGKFQNGDRDRYDAKAAGGVSARDVVSFVKDDSGFARAIPKETMVLDMHGDRSSPMLGADAMEADAARFKALQEHFGGPARRQGPVSQADTDAAPKFMDKLHVVSGPVLTSAVIASARIPTPRSVSFASARSKFFDGMMNKEMSEDLSQDPMPVLKTLSIDERVVSAAKVTPVSESNGAGAVQRALGQLRQAVDGRGAPTFQTVRGSQDTWLRHVSMSAEDDETPVVASAHMRTEDMDASQQMRSSQRWDHKSAGMVASGGFRNDPHRWTRSRTATLAASGQPT